MLNWSAAKTWKKIKNTNWTLLIFFNVVISAIVGAFFGYYSANLNDYPSSAGGTFIRRQVQQNQIFTEDALVIDVAKKSSPAVVSIVASKDLAVMQQQGGNGFFGDFCRDHFFKQFFGQLDCPDASVPESVPKTKKTTVSAGSGFIVRANGLVVTNKHVVDVDKADFTVLTNDGKKYPAQVLAKDPFHDLAVLKISGSNFPTLSLGDSDQLQAGQSVIAIGNALGEFSNTVSRGVISGLSRSIVASSGISSEKLDQLIQTDAAINPGNSGGPLLNLEGKVIGINTAIAQGAQNIGFAIPVNQIKKAIKEVERLGKVVYPYLGVRYVMITPEIKKANNLNTDYGALVISGKDQPGVVNGSPADRAGLKERDVILEINGKKLSEDNDLAKIIQNFGVGETVNLKVLRDDKEKIFSARLEERK